MVCDLGEHSIFRANPGYKLVLLDRLSVQDRQQLERFDDAEDLYGALVPQENRAGEWRSVSCETALLFMTLTEGSPLPRYVLRRLGQNAEHTIKRLLLDGILQILVDGQFVCGPQVAEMFAPPRPYSERGRNFDLTISALRYGQHLIGLPESELGYRLYCYGRQPISPQLHRLFADTAAVAAFLGIGDNGTLFRSLERQWIHVPVPQTREYWWQWISKSDPPRVKPQRACYKLYVSPVVTDLRTVLEAIFEALPHAQGVSGFKVGVGLQGISRPDKILVYFTELDDLRGFADLLRTGMSGCAPHGVPFTAAVSKNGLLSWGADPPADSATNMSKTSWRMWVTRRLAEYLTSAQMANLNMLEPWQYSLERLRLVGVDTNTWVPANWMWPEALETA